MSSGRRPMTEGRPNVTLINEQSMFVVGWRIPRRLTPCVVYCLVTSNSLGSPRLTCTKNRDHFLRKYIKHETSLHIDATGAVTNQIGAKRLSLYAVVAEGETCDSSYPPLPATQSLFS